MSRIVSNWPLLYSFRTQFKPNGLKIRNSGHVVSYRCARLPEKKTIFLAEAVSALMWWWVFYHIVKQPEMITGEYEYPDVRKWTNKELGIPRDDL